MSDNYIGVRSSINSTNIGTSVFSQIGPGNKALEYLWEKLDRVPKLSHHT